MAKSRKKKKVQPAHLKTGLPGKRSNTFLEGCYAATRRIFRALGEDESAFDLFTKRQKQKMFIVTILPPRIAAAQGHTVPRHYLRYVQDSLVTFLKRTYFDEEAGVTWMDMITVGQQLLLLFHSEEFTEILQAPQRELVQRLCSVFEIRDLFNQIQLHVANSIKMTLLMLSQPNFRIYGQRTIKQMMQANDPCLREVIHIVTHERQSLRFKYRNRERTAFRIAMGQYTDSVPYTGATIAMRKIYPGIQRDRNLDIYIQSHAIHRFKERIDTLYPLMRNEFFVLSLMLVQQIVQGPEGTQYIACIMPTSEGREVTIGYFAFTIDGNSLLVLTLLPLLSSSVPEGRVLHDRLHLSTEDVKYLGMDRLSFFYEVDIDRIPILRQILYDELHLDYIRTLYNPFRIGDDSFNEKKTLFVKNFFRNLEDRPFDSGSEQDEE
ncbi:MAG: hypothetical protein LBJ01_03205 [Tannerella sp.]|jgi:hypothetical protein|nr:hypothetical protein [Tannerella sp.]